jgi:hypothetical protein
MLKRIMEKLGPEGSARLIETLYDLIVVKKMTRQALKKKLEEGVGRPSKIHTYIKNMDAQEALKHLKQDLQEGRIGRATYFRAKKRLNQPR